MPRVERRTTGPRLRTRPVAAPVDEEALRAAVRRAAAGGPAAPDEVRRRAGRRGRAGAGRHDRPALLRLRDRRVARPPSTAADMLTVRLGPERRSPACSPRPRARPRRRPAAWLKELLGIPATASVRLRHRRPGGQHRRPRGRPAPRLAEAGLGRGARRPGRRPAGAGRRQRRAARHHRPVAAAARASATRSRRAGRRRRQRRDRRRRRCAGCWPTGRPARSIVCLQAGNVNTGACDDLRAACEAVHEHGRLGARGRRVRAVGRGQPGARGTSSTASSWPTRGHATPTSGSTCPYDCGVRASARAPTVHVGRDVVHRVVPDRLDRRPGAGRPGRSSSSRRARGFAVWAALRSSAATGVADLVDRCCRWRGGSPTGSRPAGSRSPTTSCSTRCWSASATTTRTDRVIAAIQRDGTCWMGGTTWHGRRLMRIAVSNWSTTEADVDRSVEAILRIAREDF